MKTCPNCGNQIADDAAFCNNCGVSVAVNTQAASDNAKSVDMNAQASNTQQGPQPTPQPQPTPNFGQAPYQQPLVYSDPKDHTKEFDAQDIADNRIIAIAAYLFGIIGVLIAFIAGTPFTRFHARNSLRISIAAIIILIPSIIPFLGWLVTGICAAILGVIKIVAIVWACMGKAKELPIISDIGFLS